VNSVAEVVDALAGAAPIRETRDALQESRNTTLLGLACSARGVALAHLQCASGRPLLVVVPSREEAEALVGDLEACLGEDAVFYFPDTEVLPYDSRSPHVGLTAERVESLAALAAAGAPVTVTTASALAGRTLPRALFDSSVLRLRTGGEIALDDLTTALAVRGFRRERLVEEIGTFAVRGGLIDLYPFGERNPIRVELFGDEIESIRSFDAATQLTVSESRKVTILPQRELILTDEVVKSASARGDLPFDRGADPFVEGVESYLPRFHPDASTLLDYLPDDAAIVLDEPGRVRDEIASAMAAAEEAHAELTSRGRSLPAPSELRAAAGEIAEGMARRTVLRLALFEGESVNTALAAGEGARPETRRLRVHSQEAHRGNFAVFRERLTGILDEGHTVHILCDNRGQADRLSGMLDELAERVHLRVASLRNGFSIPDIGLVVLTDHELFARTGRRYRAFRHGGGAPIHDYAALRKGDFVVHVEHGLARYAGIHLLRAGGVESECLLLRYSGGDTLYVPVDQLNLVQKYVGGESGESPPVHRLGSGQWEKVRARARKSVEKMAAELLEIHAARTERRRDPYPPDGEWQTEMEASFIYEETRDQRRATDDVKRDMTSPRPMDRLVCGDVGYGKTEVAIRAAFKAATEGRQVAVLVPTTILAQQHLNTFRERLAAYPVVVEMLSRFVAPKDIRQTVARIGRGEVDIVIGTHRILSKDVMFPKLGLVIVDEEQRFGVAHKEKLKRFRRLVDVLTLTATPIPRTLSMAISGLRDISVINTPPPNKLPIETEVLESSDEVVCKAILREIKRGGQVFFVHNRVRSIGAMAERLRELLPELRFDVAHGQMAERELEKVMMEFLDRRSDVLVSTMIIESGLDLPNVNTILVSRADTLGLAQLYQLRGRVGRSNHRAFAYLLLPPGGELSDVARKRLRAIEEFSDLGSGFRLATRDMEIRGVGNFLGPEQTGHVHAIGYDLYCRLLREEIARLRGEAPPEERSVVKMTAEVDAFLPPDYIDDPDQRILFYKRLADLSDRRELPRVEEELRDRYGRLPDPARHLLLLKEMRLLAESGGVEELFVGKEAATLRLADGCSPSPATMKELLRVVPGDLSFRADGREGLRLRLEALTPEEVRESIRALLRVLGDSDTVPRSGVVE
jgi:transcription-repair coupling factor (superfamily II helicase)